MCLTTEGDKLSEKGDWSYYLKKSAAPTLPSLTLPSTKVNDGKALQIGHDNKTSDSVVVDPSALKATESTAEATIIEQQISAYAAKKNVQEPVPLLSPKNGPDGKPVVVVPTVEQPLLVHLTVATSKQGVEDNRVAFLDGVAKALGATPSRLSLSKIAELKPPPAIVPNEKSRPDLTSEATATLLKSKQEQAAAKVTDATAVLKVRRRCASRPPSSTASLPDVPDHRFAFLVDRVNGRATAQSSSSKYGHSWLTGHTAWARVRSWPRRCKHCR